MGSRVTLNVGWPSKQRLKVTISFREVIVGHLIKNLLLMQITGEVIFLW